MIHCLAHADPTSVFEVRFVLEAAQHWGIKVYRADAPFAEFWHEYEDLIRICQSRCPMLVGAFDFQARKWLNEDARSEFCTMRDDTVQEEFSQFGDLYAARAMGQVTPPFGETTTEGRTP